jgi:TRAP-type C4-dicarboxylate transport system substrate-binding protein
MKPSMSFSTLCATALLALGGIMPSHAADPIEWRYFTYFPVNDKPAQLTRDFAADVTQATGGRLKITVYSAGELPYKAPDVVKAVATDQIHMGDVAVGFGSGDVPEVNVLSLPFLCTSYDQFDKAMGAIGPMVDEIFEKKFGLKVAINWTMPPQNIWVNRPIERLQDLKGLKVRIWTSDHNTMMRQLGASPVSINSAEVITALERKVIDAAVTSALSANDWRAYDIIKTGYLPNFMMGHQVMLINGAELAKLPADVREILLKKTAEWTPKYMAMVKSGDEDARKNLVANGVKLVNAAPADLAEAAQLMRPQWDEWAQKNGAVGRTLLDKTIAACQSK